MNFYRGLTAGLKFEYRRADGTGVTVGRAVGQYCQTWFDAEVPNQFGYLFVQSRGVRRPRGEHNIGALIEQSDQADGRLDRRKVKGARAARNEHEIGSFHRPAGCCVGMGRRVDHDEGVVGQFEIRTADAR